MRESWDPHYGMCLSTTSDFSSDTNTTSILTTSSYYLQQRTIYIPGPERVVEKEVEVPVPQIGSYRPPEGMLCVAHGWGCDGVHDNWCRRGLPHTQEKCDDDCRAWVGAGRLSVANEPQFQSPER